MRIPDVHYAGNRQKTISRQDDVCFREHILQSAMYWVLLWVRGVLELHIWHGIFAQICRLQLKSFTRWIMSEEMLCVEQSQMLNYVH